MLDRATGQVMHPVVGPLAEAEALYVGPSRLAERLRGPEPGPLVVLDVGLGAGSNAVAAWRVSEARHGGPGAGDGQLRPDRGRAGARPRAGARARVRSGRPRRRRGARASRRWSPRDAAHDVAAGARRPAGRDRGDAARRRRRYWDPFSPSANPELWSHAAFAALRSPLRLARHGAHVQRGHVDPRGMLLAGFAVGDRAIDRDDGADDRSARSNRDDLAQPLDRRWLDRLRRSSAPLPADAPADAIDRIAAMRQFR